MIKAFSNKFFLMLVISLLIYFAHAIYTYQGIYGDGNGYYSYSNSLYFQKNFNFTPVYDYLSEFQGRNYIFSRIFWDRDTNPYLIGTSLTWLPSFFFVNLIEKIFKLNVGRFDLLYEVGAGLTGIFFMIAGLYFLDQYLKKYYPIHISNLVIISLFLGTGIFYYTALEPGLSHQPSFFIICFLLWWSHQFNKNMRSVFIFGMLSGFLGSVRIADTILLLPLLLRAKMNPRDFVSFLIGAFVGFLPQLYVQQDLYGNVFTHPYLTGQSGTWQFIPYRLIEYMFSPRRGLFLWSPILLLAFYGLIKNRMWTYIITILFLWLVTSSWSAYLSAGFGQRFSFSAIPFFAIGLGAVYKKIDLRIVRLIAIFFIAWNFMLIKNVYTHKDLFIQSPDFNMMEFLQYMVILS